MINLTIWSDFACPYCYIGEVRLEKAIEELNLKDRVQINYRAFELDPNAPKNVTEPTAERFARKYGLTLETAKEKVEEISKLGREEGIDFKYMNSQYTNTRDAHRLMKLAEKRYDRNTVEKLNKALFAAYFTENLELADHKVLFEKAVQSGMKADEVKEVLDTDKYVEEVILDEREAVMRGIRGVPYIVFNGSFAVPGALTLDGFKSALQRELRKQQNDAINQKGHVCGPDGCKI